MQERVTKVSNIISLLHCLRGHAAPISAEFEITI